jgi:serine/threonine-protein kinase
MDDANRWARVKALFDRATSLPSTERSAFLVAACADDGSLRTEVEELLAADARAGSFLGRPPESSSGADRVRTSAGRLPVPLGDAGFTPGEIFAGRFRIVSLSGRGGMGEVYRADDLKLGQSVAIKLLTARGAADATFQRFVSEVRLARKIAHPNVCRVYDLGHAGGRPYLAMEYVDGETLASLLRRIGRLPREKALEAARQLCAGIAAAHDAGVLHRDLKPSNIMLDGRGRIKIMDFGLAVGAGDAQDAAVAGTPAYMAPEQLAGGPVTARTDLYALGLVLFELFTGGMVFTGATAEQRFRAESAVAIVRGLRGELDPAVLSLICWCLQSDPKDRPPSADAVAAVLPGGGDLLTAAASEGRLLSPDAVAAIRGGKSLSSAAAGALLAGIIAGTLILVAENRTLLPSDVPKPPEVLAERARNILASLNYSDAPGDSEFWFESAGHIRFVYRQTPAVLIPQNIFRIVTERDPPSDVPGMATIVLDPNGRLIRLSAIPDSERSRAEPVSWDVLFGHANLAQRDFVAVEPIDTLLTRYDTHVGWASRNAGPNGRVRVSAASLAGQPVSFALTEGENSRSQTINPYASERPAAVDAILWIFFVITFPVGAMLARRNVRLGQGDRPRAQRLAVFVICGSIVSAFLRAHHVPEPSAEWSLLLLVTSWSLLYGAFAWLMYLSLEPYVRSLWPALLISWTRVMSGRFVDPLVGRDVLTGLAAGIVFTALRIVTMRLGLMDLTALESAFFPVLDSLRSGRHLGFILVFYTLDALVFALGTLFLVLVVRVAVRKQWIAVVLCIVAAALLNSVGMKAGPWTWGVTVTSAAFAFTVLLRLGFLPFAVMMLFERLILRTPATLDFRAWYAGTSFVALALPVGLAIFGYVIALRRRSVVSFTAAANWSAST